MSYGKMLTINRRGGRGGRDGGRENDRRYDGRERNAYDGGMEDRFRDRRGREHYDNGRFAPMRNEFYSDRPVYGFSPYDYVDDRRRMEYPIYNHHDREREEEKRRRKEHGYAMSDMDDEYFFKVKGRFGREDDMRRGMPGRMTREIAEEWTERMKNEDGTKGPHWSMEQVKQLREQKKELQEFDLPDVYAVLNMMYSDYCEVAKKFNVSNIDFYVCMTKAWLDDEDAGAGKAKTLMYYECVAR